MIQHNIGATTVEDCVLCGSRSCGAAALVLCLFILLLKCLKCFPVPVPFFPYL